MKPKKCFPAYHMLPWEGSTDSLSWEVSAGSLSLFFSLSLFELKYAEDQGSIPGSGRSAKEMATHSSILAWKIAWTEELGRLQPMRLQRVGHD